MDQLKERVQNLKIYCLGGLNTSNQYLLSVIYNNVDIGYLWLHIFKVKEQKKCFIYDIKIKDTYRGQGLGTKMMECIEEY
ncbi:GNAT family N-acetyltransferase, partial [Staphylococcus equorum]|uniref:GNAT family N-acetyltransferase n=1 Tax=Staphylococcus equorum TaxID=246432 RepID=UPI001F546C65